MSYKPLRKPMPMRKFIVNTNDNLEVEMEAVRECRRLAERRGSTKQALLQHYRHLFDYKYPRPPNPPPKFSFSPPGTEPR